MTLPEVIIAMSLMLVILAATLGTFLAMQRNSARSESVNELQQQTRATVDRMAKRLRNIASRADNISQPIDRAKANDFIFQVIGKGATAPAANPTNVQRYRYCLSSGTMYEQTQTLSNSTTAAPSGTACPASGWTTTRKIAGSITNATRPVFTYLIGVPPPQRYVEATTPSAAQLDLIIGIRSELYVDDDTAENPPESTLSTRVFLRNQNRKPTASFTATPASGMSLQLNGGDSDDPEGARLTFEWYDDVPTAGTKLGEGSVYVFTSAAPGTHKLWLKVTDPAGNYATTAVQTFVCGTTTGCQPS